MELKKNEQYDLERKSPLFFSIGLVVAILCVILAFEWKAEYDPMDYEPNEEIFPETYIPPVTTFETPKPPKPVEVKTPEPSLQAPIIIVGDPVEALEPTLDPVIEDIKFDDMVIGDPLPPIPTPVEYFEIVETMPEFPGGNAGFLSHISKNIDYPSRARNLGITGKVFVQFVIDTDGKITEVEVVRGIGGGCDEEAVKAIENAPNWSPGKQRGRPVKVRMVVPINFSLSD
ncbi:MAG: TonB family protein [Marinoscillum sp.]